MVRERYWTGNPYRLTGGSSSLDSQALRRRATHIAQSAKVQILAPIPLGDRIEAADLSELPSIVRSLATDSATRIKFRIMWPLEDRAVALFCDGGSVSTGALAAPILKQVVFLSAWLEFLEGQTGRQATDALQAWHELVSDEEMDGLLTTLLADDDGLDEETALDRISEAQTALEAHLLNGAIRVATEKWRLGEAPEAAAIIKAVVKWPQSLGSHEDALEPIVSLGDALCAEVKQLTKDIPTYTIEMVSVAPKAVMQLERLSKMIGEMHPSSREWLSVATGWYDATAGSIWDAAFGLHEKGDQKGAFDLTENAIKVARSPKKKNHLTEQRNILSKNLAYSEIEPIASAPSMGTLNGVGTMLYSTGTKFAPDPSKEFAILYFTVLFIPILPLTRYLAQSQGGGSWRFFGQTKWSLAMKIHLGVVCAIIPLMAVISAIAGAASPSLDSAGSSPTPYSTPYDYSTSTPATAPDPILGAANQAEAARELKAAHEQELAQKREAAKAAEQEAAKVAKRKALQSELDVLKAQLDRLDPALEDQAASIKLEQGSLADLKQGLDSTYVNRDSQWELDAYNARVDAYNARRRALNDMIDRYKEALQDEHRKVARHNKIVQELNNG
jgi:hypothetical protein